MRNYARYGYLTLLNEGYSPDDFKDEPVKTAEDELLENALESLHNVQETIENDVQEVVSTVTETADEGEPTVELPQPSKPKVRRKKNAKSDDKQ